MPEMLAATFDASGRLDSDVKCVSCGHNLRGLLPTGVCGECGQPVEWALRSPLARARAARLRSAAAWMILITPWLWMPLSWPVAYVAYWRLASPDFSTDGPGSRVIGFVRYGLFALTLVICAVLLLARGPVAVTSRGHPWPSAWLSPCAGPRPRACPGRSPRYRAARCSRIAASAVLRPSVPAPDGIRPGSASFDHPCPNGPVDRSRSAPQYAPRFIVRRAPRGNQPPGVVMKRSRAGLRPRELGHVRLGHDC